MNVEFLILNFELRTIVRELLNGCLIQNSKFKIQNLSLKARDFNVPPAFREWLG